MAFVFRSDKTSSLSPGKLQNDLGPGQYLAQTSNLPVKKNKAAFNSCSQKKVLKKDDDIPGPGSYYKDETKEKYYRNLKKNKEIKQEMANNLKAFNTLNNISNNLNNLEPGDPLESVSNLVFNKNAEKLGFLGKDKRFKETTKEEETPGPGYYMKTNDGDFIRSSSSENKSRTDKLLFKYFTSDIKDKTKISSIPCKGQSFGYDLDADGLVKKIGNPEFYKHFQGERNDSVGPGNYELDDNKWIKKGTQWSKSKVPKLVYDEKKEGQPIEEPKIKVKLSKSFDNIDVELRSSTTKFSDLLIKKKEIKKLLDNNQTRKKNRQNMIKEMMQISKPLETMGPINKQFAKECPGPGYYYDDRSSSSFKLLRYPEFKQNFQSNMQRFKEPNEKDPVGPGSYFKDNGKLESEKMKDIKQKIFAPIGTKIKEKFQKTKSILSDRETEETPGPGQYDPSKDFQKTKNFSNQMHFGSTEKRFVDFSKQIKSNTPGPGAYIDSNSTAYNTFTGGTQNKWFNPGKTDGFKRFTMNDVNKRQLKTGKLREERLIEFKDKDIKPPVGTYNPDIMSSIQYKVNKNCSKMTLVQAAFNSTISKSRFETKEEDFIPGPGHYYHEKKVEFSQVYPPFKLKDIRFIPNKADTNVGPGNYNQTSHFDWNKKTFNILYL